MRKLAASACGLALAALLVAACGGGDVVLAADDDCARVDADTVLCDGVEYVREKPPSRTYYCFSYGDYPAQGAPCQADSDCLAPPGPCEISRCSEGVCVSEPEPYGAERCGEGNVCNGGDCCGWVGVPPPAPPTGDGGYVFCHSWEPYAGKGAACASDADCPAPLSPCEIPVCDGGSCGVGWHEQATHACEAPGFACFGSMCCGEGGSPF